MTTLKAQKRKETGKKVKILRRGDKLPAVLYGPEMRTAQAITVDLKEFQKIFLKEGESTLFDLDLEGKKYSVLIHDLQRDPLTSQVIHVDFYAPSLKKQVEVMVPIVLEGKAQAVKDLGGTLVSNITEVKVKALPQNLPHEIRVDVSVLRTFEDYIRVKDLKVSEGVEILRDKEDIVAHVVAPTKVEEELAVPIEEKVEEVEKVGEKEKLEKAVQEAQVKESAPAQEKAKKPE